MWEVPQNAGLPFDFVIFSGFCTCFIKVRRTRSNLSELLEILQLCNADIRTMPESAISAWELGVLAPHGTWQFFRIMADAVTEIRSDGSAMPGSLGVRRILIPYSRLGLSFRIPVAMGFHLYRGTSFAITSPRSRIRPETTSFLKWAPFVKIRSKWAYFIFGKTRKTEYILKKRDLKHGFLGIRDYWAINGKIRP